MNLALLSSLLLPSPDATLAGIAPHAPSLAAAPAPAPSTSTSSPSPSSAPPAAVAKQGRKRRCTCNSWEDFVRGHDAAKTLPPREEISDELALACCKSLQNRLKGRETYAQARKRFKGR
jgi:hypothetical protein